MHIEKTDEITWQHDESILSQMQSVEQGKKHNLFCSFSVVFLLESTVNWLTSKNY